MSPTRHGSTKNLLVWQQEWHIRPQLVVERDASRFDILPDTLRLLLATTRQTATECSTVTKMDGYTCMAGHAVSVVCKTSACIDVRYSSWFCYFVVVVVAAVVLVLFLSVTHSVYSIDFV